MSLRLMLCSLSAFPTSYIKACSPLTQNHEQNRSAGSYPGAKWLWTKGLQLTNAAYLHKRATLGPLSEYFLWLKCYCLCFAVCGKVRRVGKLTRIFELWTDYGCTGSLMALRSSSDKTELECVFVMREVYGTKKISDQWLYLLKVNDQKIRKKRTEDQFLLWILSGIVK